MKTLVAGDDRDTRELLTSILSLAGYEVVQSSNGFDAWREFENDRFAIVISEWLMSEVSGLELCRRIRSADRSPYPYVILLTALASKKHFLEAMDAGADDFISKPFDLDELRAKLHVAERIVSVQTRVKALEGVLPTCMYCKKIRDDNHVWISFEQYVTERSNAVFSHGVCPDCYSKAASQLL